MLLRARPTVKASFTVAAVRSRATLALRSWTALPLRSWTALTVWPRTALALRPRTALALRPGAALVAVARPLVRAALPFAAVALALPVTAALLVPLALAFRPLTLRLAAERLAALAALTMITARAAALPERPGTAVGTAWTLIRGRPARAAPTIVVWRFHCANRYSRAGLGCTAAPAPVARPWTAPAQAGMVA